MEFVTIHQLSREFDLPARVVRYRFQQLRQEARLKDGEDYRRDDYVDEQHFVWKINPLSFIRETGLKPVSQVDSTILYPVTKTEPVVNQPVNEPSRGLRPMGTGGNFRTGQRFGPDPCETWQVDQWPRSLRLPMERPQTGCASRRSPHPTQGL